MKRDRILPRHCAFSLAEILAVLAIFTVLAAVSIPAMYGTLRSSRLTVSGQRMIDELNSARHKAMSLNTPVEVRFYLLPSEDSKSVYRAFQMFTVSTARETAVGNVEFLPSPVIISPGPAESPLLSSPDHPELPGLASAPVGSYGSNYRYRAFRFDPDGSVDLSNSENYFTLVIKDDKALSDGANFYTIQADPISGAVRSFRP